MLRAGETTASKDAGGHLKVAAELLTHHIGGNLGGAEDRMQAVVDRHVLVDAIEPVGVIVAFLQLPKRQIIRAVAVYLISAGKADGGVLAEIARGYQDVHSANRIHV